MPNKPLIKNVGHNQFAIWISDPRKLLVNELEAIPSVHWWPDYCGWMANIRDKDKVFDILRRYGFRPVLRKKRSAKRSVEMQRRVGGEKAVKKKRRASSLQIATATKGSKRTVTATRPAIRIAPGTSG